MRLVRFHYGIFLADICCIAVAIFLAFYLRYGGLAEIFVGRSTAATTLTVMAMIGLWGFMFSVMRLDGLRDGWRMPAVISHNVLAIMVYVAVLLSTAYLFRQYYSRIIFFNFLACFALEVIVVRYLSRVILAHYRRQGFVSNVVIFGDNDVAIELSRKLQAHPELLCRVVGRIVPEGGATSPDDSDQVLSSVDIVPELQLRNVDELIVIMPENSVREVMAVVEHCRSNGVRVSFVPTAYELYLSRTKLVDVGGLPLIRMQEHVPGIGYRALKRGMDLTMGTLLAVITLPWILLSAAWILAHQRRPFTREWRIGREGKRFKCWSLNAAHPLWQESSLTELPQLWNVVAGDMSLVGPRPEDPERVKRYSPWQRQRLSVKPGITGLAQVHGLRALHASEEKARFDLQYILKWSPWLDLSLMIQTPFVVAGRLMNNKSSATVPAVVLTSAPKEELNNVDCSHAGQD